MRFWKVLTKQEPPYNKWIDYQEWHDRNWRRFNLQIVEFDRENNRIKVVPSKIDLKGIIN